MPPTTIDDDDDVEGGDFFIMLISISGVMTLTHAVALAQGFRAALICLVLV